MDFSLSFSVVFPLCTYIFVGILAQKLHLLDEPSVARMNSMMFRLLFPLMMFTNMQSAASALRSSDISAAWLVLAITLLSFLLLCIFVPIFIKDPERRGTFIQGCFRGNGMLFALPILTSLCGEENIGLATVCLTVIVPCYNVLSVVLLKVSTGGKVNPGTLIADILKNPLIIGAIIGLIVLVSGLHIPAVVQQPISTLSSVVSPMALILLGAGLKFSNLKRDLNHVFAVSFIRLILYPLFSTVLAYFLGCSGVPLLNIFVFNSVPTAVGSYTMAKEMGSDGDFAGEVVAISTIASLFTIFFWITLLSALGLITY